ncbi:Fe-S cluster assembly ATPase SufC [Petrocella sp. FN5]|uniref:Fe-S cluster assembly ATPase SufC n=1 Tax=Petrocella sp. FN5 TaxID=3032002 RepID=UPI0023DB6DF8|nr:Fe-S cluster assembly ATPase SufC [Petrocella sp. FN5]MDF1616732.1 Fe-S cluster assembly ATPase SufC [Petrocella sp. FN5]
MSKLLLKIEGLRAQIDNKEIIKGVDLKVHAGEIHIIMGPNGAGKSTLAYTLMGHPNYKVLGGQAFLEGENLLEMKVDERAKKGLFLSFQYPEVIPGITVENFLRTAKNAVESRKLSIVAFSKLLKEKMATLGIDESYAKRYLNQGFSGGEKKKNEILQMKVLNPKVAILDETDSGLDVDAIRVVAEGVNQFANKDNAMIIITHYKKLLDYIKPDYVHILKDGQIIQTGDIGLAATIDEEGFAGVNTN